MKEMLNDLEYTITWLEGLHIESGEDVGIRNKLVKSLKQLNEGISGPLKAKPEELRKHLGQLYARTLLGAVNKWLGGRDAETGSSRFRLEKFINVISPFDLETDGGLIEAVAKIKNLPSVDSAADFAHCLFESMQENKVMPMGFIPPWLNLSKDGKKADPSLWLTQQILEYRKIYLEEQKNEKISKENN